MKYKDFYRLFDLDNGFDNIKETEDIHAYAKYVKRTPKLNHVCFDTLKSIEEVVAILSTLIYSEGEEYDYFTVISQVVEDSTVPLCEIQKYKDSKGNTQYRILCINNATNVASYDDNIMLVFSTEDIYDDDELIFTKGWAQLTLSDRCYFKADKSSLDIEFCFFTDEDDSFPKTYSNESLNTIIGSKNGLFISLKYLAFNYNAGITKVPFYNNSVVDYIDEGSNSIAFTMVDENAGKGKYLAICETAGDQLTKEVSIEDFTLVQGAEISVYFLYPDTNTTQDESNNINVTLKINDGPEIPISINGARQLSYNIGEESYYNTLTAGWHTFYYDGLYWQSGLKQNKIHPSKFLLDDHTIGTHFYFNTDLSTAKVTSILSGLSYDYSSGITEYNDIAIITDTLFRINGTYPIVYSLNLTTLGGSGYAMIIVRTNYDQTELEVEKIVFVSEYSETNLDILQQLDSQFSYSEAGWQGDTDYDFEGTTYVIEPDDVLVNCLVTTDQRKTLWKMINLISQ